MAEHEETHGTSGYGPRGRVSGRAGTPRFSATVAQCVPIDPFPNPLPERESVVKSSLLLASQEHFGRMLTRGFGNCRTPEHARNFFDTFLLAKHGDTA